MKRIEFDEVCVSCGGTGLYKGMGERDGYAVVCSTCKGTGCHHFAHEYEEFTERKPRTDIHTVLQCNPGIGVCGSDKRFGGMPYTDWAAGKPFEIGMEMREFTCPAWWYQSADYDKMPDWDECIKWGSFSNCEHFKNKKRCWERFDKEAAK